MTDLKKELIFGITGFFGIILLVIYYSIQYKNEQIQFQLYSSQTGSASGGEKVGASSSVVLTKTEVGRHAVTTDCWIIIQDFVYNATSYINLHPGGSGRITPYCGQDATGAYSTQGGKGSHSTLAYQDLSILKLGRLNEPAVVSDVSQKINDAIQSDKFQGKGEKDDDD